MLKILLFPFTLISLIVGTVLRFAGGLVSFILGLLLAAGGFVLCATIVGAILGVPLFLLGAGLMLKALF